MLKGTLRSIGGDWRGVIEYSTSRRVRVKMSDYGPEKVPFTGINTIITIYKELVKCTHLYTTVEKVQ